MERFIDVIISPDGSKVEVDAVGFQGQGCKEAAGPFREAFGAPTQEINKPELYENPVGVGVGQQVCR